MILNLCKKCRDCCREDGYRDILMSLYDAKKIKFDYVKKIGQLYKFKKNKNAVCHFLGPNGCILTDEKKPLDCRLFPVTFSLNKNWIKFFFLDACPKIKNLSESWIRKTEREAIKELKNWSEKEIQAYVKTDLQWRAISIKN